MPRSKFSSLCGSLAVLLVPFAVVRTQSPVAASDIHGQVVHAVSGVAIGLATVDLTNVVTGASAGHATSAADGISKELIAKEIASIIEARELTQTEAAYLINDAPSQISQIVTGKLRGFSAERLLRIVTKLGRDVEIRVSKAKGKTGAVRVSTKG